MEIKTKLRRYTGNDYTEVWFALPALLVLFALVIAPMVWSLVVSFTNLNLTIPNQRVQIIGFENYIGLLQNDRFWNALWNTAYYVGVGVAIQFGIGFAVALFMAKYTRGILNQMLFTVLLLPMMMAPIVAGYMWRLIFQESFGPLNYLIGAMGLSPPQWISSGSWALNSILIADIWQWTPFMILILYTGRLAIPEDLYEAARMDGARTLFTFKHITLPQMKEVIAVALLLRSMDAFKFFDKMFVITAGGPGTASELGTYYNYILGFSQFSMGKATAMSWVLLIIAIVLANLFLLVLDRQEAGGAAP
jgi:multiple sugar transport system permease protein